VIPVLEDRTLKVPETNIMENIIQNNQIISSLFLEDLSALPRPEERKPLQENRPPTPWKFEISIFAPYV